MTPHASRPGWRAQFRAGRNEQRALRLKGQEYEMGLPSLSFLTISTRGSHLAAALSKLGSPSRLRSAIEMSVPGSCGAGGDGAVADGEGGAVAPPGDRGAEEERAEKSEPSKASRKERWAIGWTGALCAHFLIRSP